jgi:hypothetical protein
MEAFRDKKKPWKRNGRNYSPNFFVSEENLDHPTFRETTMKERYDIIVASYSLAYVAAGLGFLLRAFFFLPSHLHTCTAIMAGQGYGQSLSLSSVRRESHVAAIGFYILS